MPRTTLAQLVSVDSSLPSALLEFFLRSWLVFSSRVSAELSLVNDSLLVAQLVPFLSIPSPPPRIDADTFPSRDGLPSLVVIVPPDYANWHPVHFVVVPFGLTARAAIQRAHCALIALSTAVLSLFWLSVYKSQVSPDLHPGPRAGRLGPGALPLHFALWLRVTWPPLTWGLVSPLGAPGHNHIPTPSHSNVITPWLPSSVLQHLQLDWVFPWEFMQDLSLSVDQTGNGT
jgi:hypothetical protein